MRPFSPRYLVHKPPTLKATHAPYTYPYEMTYPVYWGSVGGDSASVRTPQLQWHGIA